MNWLFFIFNGIEEEIKCDFDQMNIRNSELKDLVFYFK